MPSRQVLAALALIDATTGNLAQLETRDLTQYECHAPGSANHMYNFSGEALMCAAAEEGHAEMVHWLVNDRFPSFIPHLKSHMAALSGCVATYDEFLKKWPYPMNIDLDHMGNPTGYSVFGNDEAMMEYLLSEKKIDPNTTHFIGRPVVCTMVRDCRDLGLQRRAAQQTAALIQARNAWRGSPSSRPWI